MTPTEPDITEEDLPPIVMAMSNRDRWTVIGWSFVPVACLGFLFLYTMLVE